MEDLRTGGTSAEKKKRITDSVKFNVAVMCGLSALWLLVTIIFYSLRFTNFDFGGVHRAEQSFWSASKIYYDKNGTTNYIDGINVVFIILFVVGVVAHAVGILLYALKRNRVMYFIASGIGASIALAGMIVGTWFGVIGAGTSACCVLAMTAAAGCIAFALVRGRKATEAEKAITEPEREETAPDKRARLKRSKLAVLVCECVAMAIIALTLFIPVRSGGATSGMPIAALSSSAPVDVTVIFGIVFVAFFCAIVYFVYGVCDYSRNEVRFVRSARKLITIATVYACTYFIGGFVYAFVGNVSNGGSSAYFTVAYIPMILAVVDLAVSSVFFGKLDVPAKAKMSPKTKRIGLEMLIFELSMTVVTFLSLLLRIVQIDVSVDGETKRGVSLTGYELLSTYGALESGFQIMAFVEMTVLIVSGVMFAASCIAYFVRDKRTVVLCRFGVALNFVFVFALGLFGLYFGIAQKVNEENIKSIIAQYGIKIDTDTISYDVSSQTIYMLIASAIIATAMLVRSRMHEKFAQAMAAADEPEKTENAKDVAERADADKPAELPETAEVAVTSLPEHRTAADDFDACPAFTDIDEKIPMFAAETEERNRHAVSMELPDLVRFIVDYARESRLHLSYSAEDVATFVAGMGASRLAILQGMSGTGKTSLPKIFTEAIMGKCEIVEVESSWRDKNELLGYYNEFSKCFTPKKFTQALYRAKLDPTVTTLIVLDEMNLSRIEYYFSDFLSLMENEQDKREIKLSNVKLYRRENGENVPYAGLTDGHTVKIPPNVWFVGTANRDESTFGISDKVYDRAQTMNFNKRAPKVYSYGAPLDARFVPYGALVDLFEKAKENGSFDAEKNAAFKRTEEILAPYNISFGNRILRQAEDFVNIYSACFGDAAAAERDAVERILLSKVVCKLETKTIENKDALSADFDKAGLKRCAEFVRGLSED